LFVGKNAVRENEDSRDVDDAGTHGSEHEYVSFGVGFDHDLCGLSSTEVGLESEEEGEPEVSFVLFPLSKERVR